MSEWRCDFCGINFKSDRLLQRHLETLEWRNSAKPLKRSGEIECKFCSKRFEGERDFTEHWDTKHENWAEERKYLFPIKRDKTEWVTRPMEEQLIRHNLRKDSSYAALRNNFTVNELVIAELDHGVEQEAMTVIEIVGIPGVGKSLFALTLGRLLQDKWLDRIILLYKRREIKDVYAPKVFIGFDLKTTLNYLRDARRGDTIIQDEDPEMMGAHSSSSKSQIENIMKVMRKACINFIFVSPISTPYINMPNLVFEVTAKNKEKRQTKAALYDRKYHAAGWVVMKILDAEDALLVAYDNMKDENLDSIKTSGGRRSVNISEEQVLDDMRTLIGYLKRIKYNFTKRHSLADLIEYGGMAGVEGDSLYQRLVAKQVKDFMEERIGDLLDEDMSESMDIKGKYLIRKEKEFDDPSFLESIYEARDEAMDSITARSAKKATEPVLKKYKPHHAKAWYNYYYHGLPYDSVGNIFGVTGQLIANSYKNGGYNAIFQEEIQGECAEIALQKQYFNNYKNVGGTGKPDLVLLTAPTMDWIEVKCFQRLSEKIETLISKFEFEFVDKGGTLRLALITYKQRQCKIIIYKISLNPDYKSVDEIKAELSEESIETPIEEDTEEEFDIFGFGEE